MFNKEKDKRNVKSISDEIILRKVFFTYFAWVILMKQMVLIHKILWFLGDLIQMESYNMRFKQHTG